ncbi:MAG: CPBP family intramembrane metalloprotease [Armatimonadota bacterium]|nr:MAG: CPBP family intramembrane metalloprotease [Armatimonadota bacterium]
MGDLGKHRQLSDSILIRSWKRIPLVVRSIVVGFLVYAITGAVIWALVLAVIPAPWSLAVMLGVLVVFWKYFSGDWGHKKTAESRRRYFRGTKLPTNTWIWSMAAAMLAVVAVEAGFVITFRAVQFPADEWALGYDFSSFPTWLVWLYIVMAACVAGITEEVGFRGYMQSPIEGRYGPVVGVAAVSIVFTVIHLNQAWAPPVLIVIFSISVLWGILAYASRSLIPGVVSHIAADIINFSYWWTDVAGKFERQPISQTGIDAHFVWWVLILLAALVLFAWTARKTLESHNESPQ